MPTATPSPYATGAAHQPPVVMFDAITEEVAEPLRDACSRDCSLELHAHEVRQVVAALLDAPHLLRALLAVADHYQADDTVRAAIRDRLDAIDSAEDP